jgi:16S rRNA (guanine966-N2)-methyltransferase
VRIIAGELKGRRIDAPKGTLTRPTSDFVRETAFNLIGPLDGAAVLDLYAGSGALGLEALSRGADSAVFVDSSRDACRTIGANLDKLGLRAAVLCNDVARVLATDRGPYDLILADPPYTTHDYADLAGPVATPARGEPALEGLTTRTSRKYGSARLTLFEL